MNAPSECSANPPFDCNDNPLQNPVTGNSHTAQSIGSPLPSQTPQPCLNSYLSTLPAVYHDKSSSLQVIDVYEEGSLRKYLEWELTVSRLNEVHDYLWLAGRPMSARPLHRQVMLGRDLVITEQMVGSTVSFQILERPLLSSAVICTDTTGFQNSRSVISPGCW